MEVKKKFEKPQMEVVQLKPAGMVCSSGCLGDECPSKCYTESGGCLFES